MTNDLKSSVDLEANDSTRSTIERVRLVLGAFTRVDRPLTLSDLSRFTGLPKSTLHRTLAQLTRFGFLERADNVYTIGIWMWEIGSLIPESYIRDRALPFLEDLGRVTRHTSHLAVRDGADVVYLVKLTPHRAVKSPSRVGKRLPASVTAIGKMLLASMDTAELDSALADPLPARTTRSITDRTLLEGELMRIRERGVAYEREESAIGIACVAVPIYVGGEVVAAISVSGPVQEFDADSCEQVLRSSARGIGASVSQWRMP